MGNESSSITSKALNANGKSNGKVIAREVSPHLEVADDCTTTEKKAPKSFKALKKRRSKAVLKELNGIATAEESDCNEMNGRNGVGARGVTRNGTKRDSVCSALLASEVGDAVDSNGANLLAVPGMGSGSTAARKTSYTDGMSLSVQQQNGGGPGSNRRRSRSLCTQQMKADCAAVSGSSAPAGTTSSRRSSNGVLPSLARLRVQQSYKNAKAKGQLGQLILKRACSLRSEIKSFLSCMPEEKVEELANVTYSFITDCVTYLDDPERITDISNRVGEMYAQMYNYGFRPEFFSTVADATIAECVRLDGGTHKRCETLLAWSQLMAFMFSGVRDGYYAEIRQQRRSSLPRHGHLPKQSSCDIRNSSFDMDL